MHDARKHFVLLVVADASGIDSFLQALSASLDLEVARSPVEAAHSIERKLPSIVLCAAQLLEPLCAALPKMVTPAAGQAKWVIITPGKIDDYFQIARAHAVYNLYPESMLANAAQGVFLLENQMYRERAFGLKRYLRTPHLLFGEAMHTRKAKRELIEKAVNYFATCGYEIHELYDARLVLEEMVNNALFHAFANERGEERYQVAHFEQLAPGERIEIEFGNDAEAIGFAVTDNGGRLQPATIIEKLARQYNREGIFDESGRGLYLSRMFSSLLVINIEKGKRTQMVAIFGEKREDAIKPLCVNYFE
jgi:anti-sigma regulatory factor (Ser/Thr protein kinase)